jgi:uncharacterized metal-binding protein
MAESCCAPGGNVMILACSGGSNVGQLSNQAAIELTQEGFGKMFCLAGIGAHLQGFVQSAKDVPSMVAIDGCSQACAKKTLEHADIPMKSYLVLSDDLGIEKNKDFNLKRDEIEKVKAAVKDACAQSPPATGSASTEGAVKCCG